MAFEELKEAIEEATSVKNAAVILLRELADKLQTMRPDEAELRRLAAELRQSSAELASAVAEHEGEEEEDEEEGGGEGGGGPEPYGRVRR